MHQERNLTLTEYTNQLLNPMDEFPKQLMKRHMLKFVVELDVNNLKYLPPNQKTDEIYNVAIKAYGKSLEEFLARFPDEELNQKIAEFVVELDSYNLQYIYIP